MFIAAALRCDRLGTVNLLAHRCVKFQSAVALEFSLDVL